MEEQSQHIDRFKNPPDCNNEVTIEYPLIKGEKAKNSRLRIVQSKSNTWGLAAVDTITGFEFDLPPSRWADIYRYSLQREPPPGIAEIARRKDQRARRILGKKEPR